MASSTPLTERAEGGDGGRDDPVLRLMSDGKPFDRRPEPSPHLAGPLPISVEEPAAGLGRHAENVPHMPADELPTQGRSFEDVEAAEAFGNPGQARQVSTDRQPFEGRHVE